MIKYIVNYKLANKENKILINIIESQSENRETRWTIANKRHFKNSNKLPSYKSQVLQDSELGSLKTQYKLIDYNIIVTKIIQQLIIHKKTGYIKNITANNLSINNLRPLQHKNNDWCENFAQFN